MSKKALKALSNLKFKAPTVEGEHYGGASGYPKAGAYRLTSFELHDCDEPNKDTISIRAVYKTDGPDFRPEFHVSTKYEDSFEINWKAVKGYFKAAKMDEGTQEAAIEAASNPGEEGSIATCVEAIEAIEEVVIEISYPAGNHGFPQYRALPIDEDEEDYKVPDTMSSKEAADARKEHRETRKARKGGGSSGGGGGGKKKAKKRGKFED